MLANGHPDDMIEQYSTQVKYAEPLLLFHNEGGKLKDVSKGAGAAFGRTYPARGLAVGDFSNDGRLDVVISNNGARAGDPQERRRRGQPLARAHAAGRRLQPRRDRREDHVVVRRPDADAAQDVGRQLPVLARPARGARRRHGREDRLGRDRLAAAERARRAPDQRPSRSLRARRRRQGDPVASGRHRCDRPCGTTCVRRSTPSRSACSCRRTGPCWARSAWPATCTTPAGWCSAPASSWATCSSSAPTSGSSGSSRAS